MPTCILTGPTFLQLPLNLPREITIHPCLARVPDHHPPKAAKLLRVFDRRLEFVERCVSGLRGLCVAGNTHEDLDGFVRRHGTCPSVPGTKVVRRLCVRAWHESVH